MTTAAPVLNLTSAQLAELTRLETLGQYPDMYRYLKTQVDTAMQAEASTSARYEDLGILSNWLQNAAAINANDGFFKSEFVRGAVDTYSLLQNGTGMCNFFKWAKHILRTRNDCMNFQQLNKLPSSWRGNYAAT